MKKQLHFILLLLLFPFGIATAQQSKKVSGEISNTNGEALQGVSISLKSNSAPLSASEKNGTYEVQAREGDVLVFSLVGYTTTERTVTTQNEVNVTMTGDYTDLEEVIVVGYGTQKKGNLTGSVSVIESGQLERRPNLSTSTALQGLAPGVTVTSQTGSPGGDAGQIRIRGISSFGGSDSSPLVMIDGVAGSIDNIDYNLIENITVLKDAASAAIYGSRAANGVILITTKRGKDKMSVDYRGYTGFQHPTAIPEVTDGFTYMRVFNEASVNDGNSILYSEEDIEAFRRSYEADPDNFDWQEAILQGSGFTQNHFIGLAANTGILRVAPSFSYATQKGVIENTGFTRYTLRNNMDITPSEKFNIKLDMSVVNRDRLQIASEGTIWNYLGRMPTIIPIRRNGLWSEGWVSNNPVAFIEEGGNRKTNNLEFYGNLSLNYTPVPWLNLVGTIAPRYETRNSHIFTKRVETYNDDGSPAGAANTTTELEESARRYFYGNYFFTSTAEKRFADHDFKLMAGVSRESYNDRYLMGYRRDYMYDTYEVLDAGANNETQRNGGSIQEWLLVSAFGRFNYSFKDRYLFEANIRYDGSSRFTGKNQWATFPSFSAGWRISEESFMEPLRNQINQLKFRGSWGKLGNQNIGSSYYPFASELAVGSISMGGNIYPLISQNDMANPALRWEATTMTGVGLDAALFNKFSFTFDWYSKTTDGILMKLYTSQLTGLNDAFQNAGKVSNKGWEVSARYDNKFGEFSLGAGFNLSDVKNKILDMRDATDGTFLRQQQGYAINSIYGYIADGYYQSQEEIDNGPTQFGTLQPGDIRYKDIGGAFDDAGNPIGDGRLNDDDKTIIGSTIPRYTYGFNLDLGYKGFKFSTFLQGVGKVDGYLNSHYVIPTVNVSSIKPWQLDYWTPDNPNAILPRLSIASTNNPQNSTFWMRSAAYLRVKNVQLGYEIPKNLLSNLKIGGAYIYLNGQNLFTRTNFYEGYDPEINYNAAANDGVALGGGNFYPQVKVYTFGIDLKF
ncbi:TonB-dependent receptor [Sphingobacterium olei]|uniref:TonB-dependent receptor n=1 Tax=Sphingobacterium olei TaxID=2571155 RepID=A0A4U0P6H6_9SPHI|nr:TonB-dependent receptor [Sphingobacterium olei]TJZ62939.1 TonB-dependent receptor [Sphingobacterium olei]